MRLLPDLTWLREGRRVFVGDVKYKRLEGSGPNDDLYQALAYTVATGLPSATLVYAAGEARASTHRVAPAGKRLHVRWLDIGAEPADILREVARLAEQVREAGRRLTSDETESA